MSRYRRLIFGVPVAQGAFLERRSGSGSLGAVNSIGLATAPSAGLSSHLSGSPIREPGGFAARVARAGSPGRSAYGSTGSLSVSRAASGGLPPLGSPSPGSVGPCPVGYSLCVVPSLVPVSSIVESCISAVPSISVLSKLVHALQIRQVSHTLCASTCCCLQTETLHVSFHRLHGHFVDQPPKSFIAVLPSPSVPLQ